MDVGGAHPSHERWTRSIKRDTTPLRTFLFVVLCACNNFKLPVEHLERLVGESFNIAQMLYGGVLFALGLARVAVEQMAEVADAVMTVLVKRTQQFLQALLNTVRVDGTVVEGVRVASHGVAFLLVNGGQHALLVHGRKLSLLHHVLVLHRLDQFLEPSKTKTHARNRFRF